MSKYDQETAILIASMLTAAFLSGACWALLVSWRL